MINKTELDQLVNKCGASGCKYPWMYLPWLDDTFRNKLIKFATEELNVAEEEATKKDNFVLAIIMLRMHQSCEFEKDGSLKPSSKEYLKKMYGQRLA